MKKYKLAIVGATGLVGRTALKILEEKNIQNLEYTLFSSKKSAGTELKFMNTRYLVHELREMGIDCFEPFGAFYIFPSIKKFGMTSEEFANRLLEDQKLAVVPGTAFGESGEGFVRISYAYSLDSLKEGLRRIKNFINKL